MDNSINASLPPADLAAATPTSKTLPQTASTSSLPVTKKMRVLNTGVEVSEKLMGTFQLMPGDVVTYNLPNHTKFPMTIEIWESL